MAKKAIKKGSTFEELALRTSMFRNEEENTVENKTDVKDAVEEKTEVKDNTGDKIEKSNVSVKGNINEIFKIIDQRNTVISDKSNNLINISDLPKDIIEYVCKSLSIGKKEFTDAIILDFYIKNKELIKKEAQKIIKSNEINL